MLLLLHWCKSQSSQGFLRGHLKWLATGTMISHTRRLQWRLFALILCQFLPLHLLTLRQQHLGFMLLLWVWFPFCCLYSYYLSLIFSVTMFSLKQSIYLVLGRYCSYLQSDTLSPHNRTARSLFSLYLCIWTTSILLFPVQSSTQCDSWQSSLVSEPWQSEISSPVALTFQAAAGAVEPPIVIWVFQHVSIWYHYSSICPWPGEFAVVAQHSPGRSSFPKIIWLK